MTEPVKQVLLDTTVQFQRIAGSRANREAVAQELAGAKVWTTSFVFREFLRTIIKDLHMLHDRSFTVGSPDNVRVTFAELLASLASGKGYLSPRSAMRLLSIVGVLLESFKATSVRRKQLQTRLERMCETWLDGFFQIHQTDGSSTLVECLIGLENSRAEWEAMRRGDPFPEMPTFPSGAATFLNNRRDRVHAAEQAMTRAAAHQRDESLLRILGRLKREDGEYDFIGKLRPTTRGNWHLGNLLIALETPEGISVYSRSKQFGVLCPALNKPQYRGTLNQQGES